MSSLRFNNLAVESGANIASDLMGPIFHFLRNLATRAELEQTEIYGCGDYDVLTAIAPLAGLMATTQSEADTIVDASAMDIRDSILGDLTLLRSINDGQEYIDEEAADRAHSFIDSLYQRRGAVHWPVPVIAESANHSIRISWRSPSGEIDLLIGSQPQSDSLYSANDSGTELWQEGDDVLSVIPGLLMGLANGKA
ncbi:hypothetical protein IT575_00095 [bacterium]|nr:hypothetical protein [bacterium]